METFHRRVEKLHDFGPFTPRVAICSQPEPASSLCMESFILPKLNRCWSHQLHHSRSNSTLASLNEMETFHRRVESLRWFPAVNRWHFEV